MKKFLFAFLVILASALPAATGPEYSIHAICYASAEDEVAGLVTGAPKGEKINIAMVIWLMRGGGRRILFGPTASFPVTICCNSRNFPPRAASPPSSRQQVFLHLSRNSKRLSAVG